MPGSHLIICPAARRLSETVATRVFAYLMGREGDVLLVGDNQADVTLTLRCMREEITTDRVHGPTIHGSRVVTQKLLNLLFRLAFALYAPAQSATSVELVGVGDTFPLPLYTKWSEEYGALHPGVQVHI